MGELAVAAVASFAWRPPGAMEELTVMVSGCEVWWENTSGSKLCPSRVAVVFTTWTCTPFSSFGGLLQSSSSLFTAVEKGKNVVRPLGGS